MEPNGPTPTGGLFGGGGLVDNCRKCGKCGWGWVYILLNPGLDRASASVGVCGGARLCVARGYHLCARARHACAPAGDRVRRGAMCARGLPVSHGGLSTKPISRARLSRNTNLIYSVCWPNFQTSRAETQSTIDRVAQSSPCFDKPSGIAVREYAAQSPRAASNKTVDKRFDWFTVIDIAGLTTGNERLPREAADARIASKDSGPDSRTMRRA